MPTKFKPSHTIRDKTSGKNKTEHFYIKSTPTSELQEFLENRNSRPKHKSKVRKELTRRGL
tara:strand:- start:839 stop:1021 length:183 start_codon:yes stop_codon:yes gene_type:complete